MSDKQQISNDSELQEKICSLCHVGVYKPHHDFVYWVKCPVCGHTKQLLESSLSATNAANMKRNPFARHYIRPY